MFSGPFVGPSGFLLFAPCPHHQGMPQHSPGVAAQVLLLAILVPARVLPWVSVFSFLRFELSVAPYRPVNRVLWGGGVLVGATRFYFPPGVDESFFIHWPVFFASLGQI